MGAGGGWLAVEVSALADSGAMHLRIPEPLAIQLSLAELERREVVPADGLRRTVPSVGPVEVRCVVAGDPHGGHGPGGAAAAAER